MRVTKKSLETFVEAVFAHHKLDSDQIRYVTDNLVWCDLVGRSNHGVERLPILTRRVRKGLFTSPCRPRLEKLSDSMARLDGDNGLGHFIAAKAMEYAVKMARETGVGMVGVKNSNFLGAAGYYINQAAESGMVSLVMSNSFPKVAAVGGVKAVLGTNPLAFGAPRKNGRALILDMSTAAIAGSTIREKLKSGEMLPEGIAIDAAGQPIRDPAAINQGALLPAASGKGFGLALMVELLAGVLTGAGISTQVGSMYKDFDRGGDNGHFMIAIDVEKWMSRDEYYARFETMAEMVLGSGSEGEVRLPGMTRWKHFDDNMKNGIQFEPTILVALEKLASECGIPTLG